MKDIVIKGSRVRCELIVAACCLLAACGWNAYAIMKYDTSWSELYSVWYAVLIVAVVLYVVLIPLRLAGWALWKSLRRKKR